MKKQVHLCEALPYQFGRIIVRLQPDDSWDVREARLAIPLPDKVWWGLFVVALKRLELGELSGLAASGATRRRMQL